MWVRPLCFNGLNTKRNCQHFTWLVRFGGVICDPFGLDHSATDWCYPHLSLCCANSFFICLDLDHSASQTFKCYLEDETPNVWKMEEVGTEVGPAILAGQTRRRRRRRTRRTRTRKRRTRRITRRLLISLTCFFTLSFCKKKHHMGGFYSIVINDPTMHSPLMQRECCARLYKQVNSGRKVDFFAQETGGPRLLHTPMTV